MREQVHGTRNRYRAGCRCDACRAWESERGKRYRAQHPEAIAEKNRRYQARRRQRERPAIPAAAGPMADHPLIKGLLAKLPPPGQPFTSKHQQRWLDAARLNLDLIYGMDDE